MNVLIFFIISSCCSSFCSIIKLPILSAYKLSTCQSKTIITSITGQAHLTVHYYLLMEPSRSFDPVLQPVTLDHVHKIFNNNCRWMQKESTMDCTNHSTWWNGHLVLLVLKNGPVENIIKLKSCRYKKFPLRRISNGAFPETECWEIVVSHKYQPSRIKRSLNSLFRYW